MKLLLLTDHFENWEKNVQFLKEKRGLEVEVARSTDEAASRLRSAPPSLLLFDGSRLSADAIRAEATRLLMANAMVNMVVISPASDEDFHEATEGLGILMRVSEDELPSRIDEVLGALRAVTGVSRQTGA